MLSSSDHVVTSELNIPGDPAVERRVTQSHALRRENVVVDATVDGFAENLHATIRKRHRDTNRMEAVGPGSYPILSTGSKSDRYANSLLWL